MPPSRYAGSVSRSGSHGNGLHLAVGPTSCALFCNAGGCLWPIAAQGVQRTLSATGESRHSGSRGPTPKLPHPVSTRVMQYQHVVPYPAIGRPASGGYAWGYAGGSVPPSCIPQPAYKFPRKYRALADRSAIRINPDSPLGLRPLGSSRSTSVPDSFSKNSVFLLRSLLTIMAFSQMDVVASLGALLRWSRPPCASLWLRIGKRQNVKRELCTRVAPFDEEPGSALKRNRFEICQ